MDMQFAPHLICYIAYLLNRPYTTVTSCCLFFLLQLLLLLPAAQAVLLGAAVIPHGMLLFFFGVWLPSLTKLCPTGDFAYDCTLIKCVNGSADVHAAAVVLGQQIAALQPQLIFLTTPHGLAASSQYLLYGNTNGSGFALLGQDLHNASFPGYKVPMEALLAPDMAAQLQALQANASANATLSTLLAYGDSEPLPLRWGEIIPLSFLGALVNMSQPHRGPRANVSVLSIPIERYTRDVAMVCGSWKRSGSWGKPLTRLLVFCHTQMPELGQLGAMLGKYFQSLDIGVYWIVSADLAHTHLASGPYGYR